MKKFLFLIFILVVFAFFGFFENCFATMPPFSDCATSTCSCVEGKLNCNLDWAPLTKEEINAFRAGEGKRLCYDLYRPITVKYTIEIGNLEPIEIIVLDYTEIGEALNSYSPELPYFDPPFQYQWTVKAEYKCKADTRSSRYGRTGRGSLETRVYLLTAPDCLSVSLSADPSSGIEPLENVALRADVSGEALGPIDYKFSCRSKYQYQKGASTWGHSTPRASCDTSEDTEDCPVSWDAGEDTTEVYYDWYRQWLFSHSREYNRTLADKYQYQKGDNFVGSLLPRASCDTSSRTEDCPVSWDAGGDTTEVYYDWWRECADFRWWCRSWNYYSQQYRKIYLNWDFEIDNQIAETYTVLCDYPLMGDVCNFNPKVEAGREGYYADDETTVRSQPSLSVSLSADPSAGSPPLNNVDLTAQISSSSKKPFKYKFFCGIPPQYQYQRGDSIWGHSTPRASCDTSEDAEDCPVSWDAGGDTTEVYYDWYEWLWFSDSREYNRVKISTTSIETGWIDDKTYTVTDFCNYPLEGIYTARVEVETQTQEILSAEDTAVITVSTPQPPSKPTETDETWNHCGIQGLSVPTLEWSDFSDPNPEDTMGGYEIEINGFSHSAEVESSAYVATTWAQTEMNWGQNYQWRVKVKDNHGNWSIWSDFNGFSAPLHAYPWPRFSHSPQYPATEEVVEFIQNDPDGTGTEGAYCYSGGKHLCQNDPNAGYAWDFSYDPGDGFMTEKDYEGNATTTYATRGDYEVRLKITDWTLPAPDNYCVNSDTVEAQLPLPEYKEVAPTSWFTPLDNFTNLTGLKKVFTRAVNLFNGFLRF